MKKLLLIILSLAIFFIICTVVISLFFEERIVRTFKTEVIDKTSINIDFSNIQFSLIKSFPLGSFTLDDAYIFYSKKDRNDTLIHSQKLNIKVNILKLLNNVYDFNEISASNACININADKLEQLFSSESSRENSYLIKTKKISLKKCSLKYCYKGSFKIKCFVNDFEGKGVFSSKYLSVWLSINASNLESRIYDFNFNNKGQINIKTSIIGKNNEYFTEEGYCKLNSIPLSFSFLYSTKSEVLNISLKGEEIQARTLFSQISFLNNIKASKGKISFSGAYSINLNSSNINSQKLSLSYKISSFRIKEFDDFSLNSLIGTSIFQGDFSNNESEINDFLFLYNGITVKGSAKLKGLPTPYLMIDGIVSTSGNDVKIGDNFCFNGKNSGTFKSLIKINDLKNLNINTLKIIKLNSTVSISNIAYQKNDFCVIGPGEIQINDENFRYIGQAAIYQKRITGSVDVPNFFGVLTSKIKPKVYLDIECNRLNLDSLLSFKKNETNQNFNADLFCNAKINEVEHNGYQFRDFRISLNYIDRNIICSHFSSKLFSGKASGNFKVSESNKLDLFLDAKDLDIEHVFRCFNDFNQNYVTSKNISGRVSGQLNLFLVQSENKSIDPSSIRLTSSIVIEKGTLCGVKQLYKISKFLNISELDTIKFSSIKNDIEINQGKIIIPKMNIASNSINFTISGEHYFSGNYTYWLKINLNEILVKKYGLKKKTEYEQVENGGLNVFLRLSGNNDSYKISVDKKGALENFKVNFRQEGSLLKSLIKEEFGAAMKDSSSKKDSMVKKIDSLNNKTSKKTFKIEWDEIDSTKINNN